MAQKSKILIIGGTGYIGKFLVLESAKAGHPTCALVRESTASSPEKSEIIESFKSAGATLIYGDIHHHESLLRAIKQVDVVISSVGFQLIADQMKIVAAIKEAGNIKAGATAPPRDKVEVIGDGNPKAIFVKEEDVAAYTMRAVDDPRTQNKTLYISPPANILSFNEIVSLWEKKINKTLEKTYVLEDELLKKIQASPHPFDLFLSIGHFVFVKGDFTNFEIEASFGVEASGLYPEVKYTTIDEYLDQYV